MEITKSDLLIRLLLVNFSSSHLSLSPFLALVLFGDYFSPN